MGRLDVLGVLDRAIGELREGPAGSVCTLHLHLETGLLGHRGVKAMQVNVSMDLG